MSDLNSPINLKEKAEKERQALLSRLMPKPKIESRPAAPAPKPAPIPAPTKKIEPDKTATGRAQAIDQVYRDEPTSSAANNALRNFERPAARPVRDGSGAYRIATIILGLTLVGTVGYFIYSGRDNAENRSPAGDVAPKWYAVKLMNNEIYYGQVTDTSADPIVIENVYYNYDQLNPGAGETATPEGAVAASLKLVKRGKETHGPDGSMSIVRTQIVYLEPLKEDSKVLKAILDYEK